MVIHQAKTLEEAVKLRHEIENSAYLAGGTEVLRLNSSVDSSAELIDISALLDASISIDGDKLIIGAGATLQSIKECELVPEFIKDAAAFCSSLLSKSNSETAANKFSEVSANATDRIFISMRPFIYLNDSTVPIGSSQH